MDTTNEYEQSNGYIFIYMACIGMEPVIPQKNLGMEINWWKFDCKYRKSVEYAQLDAMEKLLSVYHEKTRE